MTVSGAMRLLFLTIKHDKMLPGYGIMQYGHEGSFFCPVKPEEEGSLHKKLGYFFGMLSKDWLIC